MLCVFYPVCLFSRDIQRFDDIFGFPSFAIFANRLSVLFRLHVRLLILTHLVDLVQCLANSIPQSVSTRVVLISCSGNISSLRKLQLRPACIEDALAAAPHDNHNRRYVTKVTKVASLLE